MGLFAVLIALRWAGSWRGPAAVVVGVGIWLAMFESGVDAVIAGLAVGLVTSAYPPSREELERSTELARLFREQPTAGLAYSAQASLISAISPNERLQYRLHPWTSRVIVPMFALANAGIALDGGLLSDAMTSPVTLGVVAAYVIGKPLGIMGAAWLATRPALGGRARRSPGRRSGVALFAGVGFTVSLLVATLAFHGGLLEEAKIGVLATALLSPALSRLAAADRAAARRGRAAASSGRRPTAIDLVEDVDPELDHVRGRADAPVTLVEYGDFECPYCGRAEPVIEELLGRFGDDLRFVFRHLPLNDVHPTPRRPRRQPEAAAAQGAFWPMHDRLLRNQDELTTRDLSRLRGRPRPGRGALRQDLRRRRYAAPHRARHRERRCQRRVRHADLLRQRPATPGRLRRGDAHPRGEGGRPQRLATGRRELGTLAAMATRVCPECGTSVDESHASTRDDEGQETARARAAGTGRLPGVRRHPDARRRRRRSLGAGPGLTPRRHWGRDAHAGLISEVDPQAKGPSTMPLFFFTVEQQERAIVERFGKFVRVAGPGLQRKSPFVESVAGA